jgi:hypothetical protein
MNIGRQPPEPCLQALALGLLRGGMTDFEKRHVPELFQAIGTAIETRAEQEGWRAPPRIACLTRSSMSRVRTAAELRVRGHPRSRKWVAKRPASGNRANPASALSRPMSNGAA